MSFLQINRVNEKVLGNLCRFCGEQNSNMKIDSSWNETFFDINRKLFSFTAETLDGLKICTSCVKIIDSICKFYNQVKNVSQILKKTENSITEDNALISKNDSKHHEINISGRTHEGVIEIDHQVATIESNSFQIKEINTYDNQNKNIAQEVNNKDNIFEESKGCGNSCDAKSIDSLSVLPFQSLKAENVNEINISGTMHGGVLEIDSQITAIENNSFKIEEINTFDENPDKNIPQEVINIEKDDIFEGSEAYDNPCDAKSKDSISILSLPSSKAHNFNEVDCVKPKIKTSLRERNECKISETMVNDYRWEEHGKLHLPNEKQCSYCGGIYASKRSMQRHVRRQHFTKNPVACKICNQEFATRDSLKLHKINNKCPSGFKCEICDKKFSTKPNLERHKISHWTAEEKEANAHKCPHCENKYLLKTGLQLHIRLYHESKDLFVCNICNRVYKYKNSLRQHKRKFHEKTISKKMYKCEICGKTIASRTGLKHHKKLHLSTDERQTAFFKCPHCKLQYPSRGTMLHHVRIQHLNEKPLCEICGKEFGNKWSLKLHRATHSITEKKYYECEICNKKYTTRSNLEVHKEIHSSVEHKIYRCEICDKKYTTPENLKIHKKNHVSAGNGHYECQICAKKYKKLASFKSHKKIHSCEYKKHECEICGKEFMTSGNLKLHKNIHVSKCEICGKECSTATNLKTHKKVHLDEENKKTCNIFKCPHCDAGLSNKQSMLRHIRTIHLNERFTCKTCGKAYTTLQALRIHKEKAHKQLWVKP